jgi:hypothetical protein
MQGIALVNQWDEKDDEEGCLWCYCVCWISSQPKTIPLFGQELASYRGVNTHPPRKESDDAGMAFCWKVGLFQHLRWKLKILVCYNFCHVF